MRARPSVLQQLPVAVPQQSRSTGGVRRRRRPLQSLVEGDGQRLVQNTVVGQPIVFEAYEMKRRLGNLEFGCVRRARALVACSGG
jgi:hypothetical protein